MVGCFIRPHQKVGLNVNCNKKCVESMRMGDKQSMVLSLNTSDWFRWRGMLRERDELRKVER